LLHAQRTIADVSNRELAFQTAADHERTERHR
jgi:hypothetical protein